MKRLLTFLSALFFVVTFFGCNNDSNDDSLKKLLILNEIHQKPKVSKPYLFLMYLAGDNNLYKNLHDNMISVTRGLNNFSNSKAVFFLDAQNNNDSITGKYNGTHVFEADSPKNLHDITENASFIESPFEDSGDYKTVEKFLTWAKQTYNPENDYTTILFVGSHGAGAYGQPKRTMCTDDTTGNIIFTDQFAEALRNSGYTKDSKLDMLLIDVCDCGQIEEAYEYRNSVKYLINSPNKTPGEGMPYEEFLYNFTEDDTLEDLGNLMVSLFAKKYLRVFFSDTENKRTNRPATITCTNLEKIEPLAELTTDFADYFIEKADSVEKAELKKYIYSNNTGNEDYYLDYKCLYIYETPITNDYANSYFTFDYGYLTDKIKAYAKKQNNEELEEICTKIQNQLERAIVSSWRGLLNFENATEEEQFAGSYPTFNPEHNYYGITITGNAAEGGKSPYNSASAFNDDTSWGVLLETIFPENF